VGQVEPQSRPQLAFVGLLCGLLGLRVHPQVEVGAGKVDPGILGNLYRFFLNEILFPNWQMAIPDLSYVVYFIIFRYIHRTYIHKRTSLGRALQVPEQSFVFQEPNSSIYNENGLVVLNPLGES
jgi:hypothetical protein